MTDKDKPTITSLVISTSSITATGGVIQGFNYVSPPDHEIYRLIGRVAAGWSNLEHTLDRIIWLLVPGVSSEAACVTSQLMGTAPRYRTIIAQLTLRGRQTADPIFNKLIDRTNKLISSTHGPQEKRNRIIHDAWYYDTSRDQHAQFRAWPAKELRFGIDPVDLQGIESTLADIEKLYARAEELFTEIKSVISPPSPH